MMGISLKGTVNFHAAQIKMATNSTDHAVRKYQDSYRSGYDVPFKFDLDQDLNCDDGKHDPRLPSDDGIAVTNREENGTNTHVTVRLITLAVMHLTGYMHHFEFDLCFF